jgi:mRNA interferase RelE/StbE
MIVYIDKSFEKDTDKVNIKSIRNKIAACIQNVQNANNIKEIKNLEKLKGFNTEYRIKVGDYRIGLIIENKVVTFVRFLNRKDIYKFFPK